MNPLDDAISAFGTVRLLEEHRAEIERAIDNVKRSAWDKWFRRKGYEAGRRLRYSRCSVRNGPVSRRWKRRATGK